MGFQQSAAFTFNLPQAKPPAGKPEIVEAKTDFQIPPLIYASIADGQALLSKASPYELRRHVPLKFVATVESVLADNRYIISLADNNISLRLMQRELRDTFIRLESSIEKPDEVKAGSYYLFRDSELNVFRVRAMVVQEREVAVLLVDFGRFMTARTDNLYCFREEFFENEKYRHPYAARVVLPPDEVLRSLNLPTSKMIQPGDIVDVIVFTTQEPHLVVFGFARSISRRIMPANFVEGFDSDEQKHWMELFEKDVRQLTPTILKKGYGRLSKRDQHTNRLALVAHTKSLDKIYVRDMDSAIRLPFIRERMQAIYGEEAERFAIKELSELCVGVGCVAYNSKRNAYLRVEILSMGNDKVDVAPVDELNAGLFSVTKRELFKIPDVLDFPRQCFSVRLTRHSEGQNRHYLSAMARSVIPDGTPVILNSEPEFGLTKMKCANAPGGVLSKIGFIAMGEDKLQSYNDFIRVVPSFGDTTEVANRVENINKFAESISGSKSAARSLLKPQLMKESTTTALKSAMKKK